MAKIVPVPNANTDQFDPMEERTFTITVAINDDDGNQVNILARDKETEQAVQFKLLRKKYNFETKKWEDNKDTLETSETIAQDKFNQSLDDLAKSYGHGIEFTGYTDGETGTFFPRQRFIRFDKIETADSKQLKKLTGELEPLPITESDNPGWARFNFGFQTTNNDGEKKKYRVSQILIESDDDNTPDKVLPLRYTNKTIRSFANAASNEHVPEQARADLAQDVNSMLAKAREHKVEEINAALGIDLEKLLQGEETVQFDSLDVQAVGSGESYYLVGSLA